MDALVPLREEHGAPVVHGLAEAGEQELVAVGRRGDARREVARADAEVGRLVGDARHWNAATSEAARKCEPGPQEAEDDGRALPQRCRAFARAMFISSTTGSGRSRNSSSAVRRTILASSAGDQWSMYHASSSKRCGQ